MMQVYEPTHQDSDTVNQSSLRLRVDDVAWRDVGDELIILELATSTYLTLNGSAKQLWLRLVPGASVEDLADMLVSTYGISFEQAESDTEAFLAALVERKLVEPES
jgi:hypothetical protein